MKAVHSLKSDKLKPFIESIGGAEVIKPAVQIMALSACTIRKHFDDFVLITDDIGKELAESCQLPYTEIISVGDKFESDSCFWIHSKIHAYHTIKEPFVHFDTDLFLWDALPKEFLEQEVFAFHPETSLWNKYEEYRDNILEAGVNLPRLDRTYWTSRMPVNMAIFGGTNFKAINQYAGFVLEFLADNNGFIDSPEAHKKAIDVNIAFIEQAWVSYLIQDSMRIPIETLLTQKQVLEDTQIPNVKLTHLHGAKQKAMETNTVPQLMTRLSTKLKEVNKDVHTAVNKRCAPFTDIDSLLVDSMIQQAKL
jgi:hypothetical protein